MAVLERRVADRSLLRLIGKWLSAGFVEEDGRRVRPKVGRRKRSNISSFSKPFPSLRTRPVYSQMAPDKSQR